MLKPCSVEGVLESTCKRRHTEVGLHENCVRVHYETLSSIKATAMDVFSSICDVIKGHAKQQLGRVVRTTASFP